jgi:alcohol-forming fatty acyl-CoA reductase
LPEDLKNGRMSGSMATSGSSIRELLAGKRLLITGVTGFLGQAFFERVLSDLPDSQVVLLVRRRPGRSGRDRVVSLLGGPAFTPLREREGRETIDRMVEERVAILEGDVGEDVPELPPDLDVVLHAAASVSFDAPIDDAFRSNVVGVRALYDAIRTSGASPHVLHVSTAYVAGVRRGTIAEEPLDHAVDWRVETDMALEARHEVEAASRKPEMLEAFARRASREHARAGPQVVAEDAERRRRDWVKRRLVRYGRARARTLGWPDIYTLTKALGERVAEEAAEEIPVSIVRPSIIESALLHPSAGWIEGFKMAEPIILAYGRGNIPEFPGIPEGIADLIPVDFVVNAMLAEAATPHEQGARYLHVCSGSRNPLRYQRLFELIREYFRTHPLRRADRGEIEVPDWRFPGRRTVERMVRAGERGLETADKVVRRLPRSSRVRRWAQDLDRQRSRLDFVRHYAGLYGHYVEAEVIYTDDRALGLWRTLPDEDRERFPFDAARIDWHHYVVEVHCPSVTRLLRPERPRRTRPAVRMAPTSDGVLAVFDLEGTLVASNVVESFIWLRLGDLVPERWPGAVASLARAMPTYLAAERRDRGAFLRAFYRRYEGADVEGIRRLVEDGTGELLLRRASPSAVRRIRQHSAAGHRTVLVTGALEPLVEPFRPLFDEIVAVRLEERNGRYTGFLEQPPLVGEARAPWLRRYAQTTGADLRASYVYADSHSDLPFLAAVGNPVAVNPDVGLFRAARRRGWPVEEWTQVPGVPKLLLPAAAR